MEVSNIAHAFREALDQQKCEGDLPEHMVTFPDRCCGVVSELLGHYLNASGIHAEYVCGSGHAWLECEGIVIDITGDQFEGRPPVFVGAKDDWYQSLGESSRCIARRPENNDLHSVESAVLREVLRSTKLHNPDI